MVSVLIIEQFLIFCDNHFIIICYFLVGGSEMSQRCLRKSYTLSEILIFHELGQHVHLRFKKAETQQGFHTKTAIFRAYKSILFSVLGGFVCLISHRID